MRLHHEGRRHESPECPSCTLHAGEHEIIIASDSVHLSMVRNFIRDIGERCHLGEREIFDLQVAVGEATANAIEHGSPQGILNVVRIRSCCDGYSLTINICDQGKFVRRMPAPDVEIDFRGRGIPLMLALMDKVTIDEAIEGTTVTLEKKLSSSDHLKQQAQ